MHRNPVHSKSIVNNLSARQFANFIARTLRGIRRRWFPGFNVAESRLAKAYLRLMSKAARLDYVDGIHGHRMYLDDKDSLGISVARETEPAETRLVQRTVQQGWTVLDVGANIGYYTLLLARAVGPTGRVYAFEPDPTNFAILSRNVELNGYRNVTLVNSALWSETKTLKLYLSEENRGDHRAYASSAQRTSVEIPAISLDDYFGQAIPRVDFMKMDIQGAECHALRGMKKLLDANPQMVIAMEFWPLGLKAAGTSGEEFLSLLTSRGYRFEQIGDRIGQLRPTDAKALLAGYDRGWDEFANVLCLPPGAASEQLSSAEPH